MIEIGSQNNKQGNDVTTSWNSLLVIGLLTVAALYAGAVARKLQLPALLGYMGLGVIMGPHVFSLLSADLVNSLNFIIDIGLGLVAFTIGAELKFQLFKKLGWSLAVIIFSETFLAFLVVTLFVGLFTQDWPLAILLGAIAAASAPAGTVAVIQEYQAKGPLTRTIYAVVGLDDALSVVIYGFALVMAKYLLLHENGLAHTLSLSEQIIQPVIEIGGAALIGWIGGKVYFELARRARKQGDLLILTIGLIILVCGICQWLHLSLILANMGVGIYLVNAGKEGLLRRVRELINGIMPLTFVLFFALAGAHLDLGALATAGGLSLLYFFSRVAGKAGGAWVGCVVGGAEPTIRRNLGLAILSQAGLAVGLSLIVYTELSQMHSVPRAVEVGQLVLTTITATTIMFEIIGPLFVRRSLARAGELG